MYLSMFGCWQRSTRFHSARWHSAQWHSAKWHLAKEAFGKSGWQSGVVEATVWRCWRSAVLSVGGVGGVAVGGVAVSEVAFGGVIVGVAGSDAIGVGLVVVTLEGLLLLSGLGWSDGFNRSVGWLEVGWW